MEEIIIPTDVIPTEAVETEESETESVVVTEDATESVEAV